MNKLIIDATNATLGRLASYCAKQALLGKTIVVVNCKNAVIIGKEKMIIEEYQKIRGLGGAGLHGPFFPKSPERILKRTIRGMLPHRQLRGREALKRVMCYNDLPSEYVSAKKILSGKGKDMKTIKLAELSKVI